MYEVFFFAGGIQIFLLTRGFRNRWNTERSAKYTRAEQIGIGCGGIAAFICVATLLGVLSWAVPTVGRVYGHTFVGLLVALCGWLVICLNGHILLMAVYQRVASAPRRVEDEPSRYR